MLHLTNHSKTFLVLTRRTSYCFDSFTVCFVFKQRFSDKEDTEGQNVCTYFGTKRSQTMTNMLWDQSIFKGIVIYCLFICLVFVPEFLQVLFSLSMPVICDTLSLFASQMCSIIVYCLGCRPYKSYLFGLHLLAMLAGGFWMLQYETFVLCKSLSQSYPPQKIVVRKIQAEGKPTCIFWGWVCLESSIM